MTKFNRILRLKRRERFYKFAVYKEIPTKKVFRRSSNLFWLIFIFSIVLFIFIYITNNSGQAHKPAMGVVGYSIFVLGFLVKFILSLFFPELILTENGIEILGEKFIAWNDIKKVRVNYNGNSKLLCTINKNNAKKNNANLNLSNLDELKFYIRSFMKKYRIRKNF